jgi:hypothetical protein
MFARKLRLSLDSSGTKEPVPKTWLEEFFLRDFTGDSAFDETLVTGEGQVEAGWRVKPEAVCEQLENWLRGRKMIPPETRVRLTIDD